MSQWRRNALDKLLQRKQLQLQQLLQIPLPQLQGKRLSPQGLLQALLPQLLLHLLMVKLQQRRRLKLQLHPGGLVTALYRWKRMRMPCYNRPWHSPCRYVALLPM